MNKKKPAKTLWEISPRTIGVFAVILITMVVFSIWMLKGTERRMKNDLLRQARMVAASIYPTYIQNLSGTTADLGRPEYQGIKDQLARLRQANEKCRFLYLMGRRANGEVFFFMDSQPPDSPDHAPPGLIYTEISDSYLEVFNTEQEEVVGPVTDRWGTLITALVPIVDPKTGHLIAMLGMDIDARDWKWSIAASSILPLGLLLSLLILLISGAIFYRVKKASLAGDVESYHQLLSIWDGIDEPNYVADPQTYEILYINQAGRKSWGAPEGKKCYEYLQNRNEPCPFCTNDKIFGEYWGRSYVWEFRNEVNERWYRCIDKAIKWPDGRMVRHEMALDITDRKKAEDILGKTKEQLELIIDKMPGLLAFVNSDEEYLFVNKAYADWYKTSKEKIIGKKVSDIMPQSTYRLVKENIRLVLNGETISYENFFPEKDGRKKVVLAEYFPHFDERGKVIAFLARVEDITEKKRAEDALRESEERYRLIFEKSPLGIMHFNAEGVIVACNENFARIIGSPKQRLIGFNMLDSMPEGPARSAVADALETGTGRFEGEYHTVTGDKCIHIKATHKKITDNAGVVTGAIGVFEDVTEKLLLEAKLRQAQKMEAVGTLAGGVAHDFNNLLQAIIGYTQLVLLEAGEKSKNYDKLNGILTASERARDLIQQLLLFSRKLETKKKPVDLNREIEQTCKILERTIPKMVNIELNLGRPLSYINADPVQIEQILLNLGTNAADSMPDGGNLIITTKNLNSVDDIYKSETDTLPNPCVVLMVSDTGHGMDETTLDKVFEPFFTTKEVGKGTGLGLASVYGIVKSHGGHITCSSQIGMGTTFTIYFPAEEGDKAYATKNINSGSPIGGSEVILIVDDEQSIRQIASQLFQRYGYSVLTASSGEEALDIYSDKQNEIALVILDIGMSGMGGHRCLRELFKINPEAKIIIASGYSMDGRLKETLEAGAAGFVGKPYQLFNLLQKVRAVLDET